MDSAEALFAIAALGGYLLGSVPFGLVLTRMAGLGDIREVGSGNIGATNVLRTGNKPLALATLICDSGKGGAAVYLASVFIGYFEMALVAGVMAVVGHNFPVWLRFKGGKGVATTFGMLLVAIAPVGLAACLTWLATAVIFRFSSLAAIVALAVAPLYAWILIPEPANVPSTMAATFIALLVIYRHKTNIARLYRGEEPKIGKKKEPLGDEK
jgi:acyl phosphate:glycerol-3-phosphate acyltransferase